MTVFEIAGQVSISILSCRLFTIEDRCEKVCYNKGTIKVCISCFGQCPGTSAPSAAHLTVSFILCSSSHEARAFEGRVSAQKALQTETRELLGGTEEKSVSPVRGD